MTIVGAIGPELAIVMWKLLLKRHLGHPFIRKKERSNRIQSTAVTESLDGPEPLFEFNEIVVLSEMHIRPCAEFIAMSVPP
jgi:hypothetical protein